MISGLLFKNTLFRSDEKREIPIIYRNVGDLSRHAQTAVFRGFRDKDELPVAPGTHHGSRVV
jgi:hypothetical protein